jgi:hypothetical protein
LPIAASAALGHFVERLPGGQAAIMNGGSTFGWTSQFYLIPHTGDGVVVLTNSDRGRVLIANIITDWLAWCGLPSLKMTRSYVLLGTALHLIVAIIAMSSVFLAITLISNIHRSPTRARMPPKFWLVILGATIAILVAGGWFLLARDTVLFAFPVDWPATAVVTSFAPLLVLYAISRPVDVNR